MTTGLANMLPPETSDDQFGSVALDAISDVPDNWTTGIDPLSLCPVRVFGCAMEKRHFQFKALPQR